MNVNYINPFINGCIDVFKTFAGLISVPGKPVARKQPGAPGDIKGMIGLNGHGINGYFIINFSRPFLEHIMASLFGVAGPAAMEELNDLAGELTNMITGNAKAELSKRGFFFDVAVPQISSSAPKIPDTMTRTPVIMVPFTTKSGRYAIEASIKRIEADFAEDTMPEIEAPPGMISVETFSKKTGIDPIKVRRLLKTGFISGYKVSNKQWHIPEVQLEKIAGYKKNQSHRVRPRPGSPPKIRQANSVEEFVSILEFATISGLTSAKVKSFLRTGFLKGIMTDQNLWQVHRDEIKKFKKNA